MTGARQGVKEWSQETRVSAVIELGMSEAGEEKPLYRTKPSSQTMGESKLERRRDWLTVAIHVSQTMATPKSYHSRERCSPLKTNLSRKPSGEVETLHQRMGGEAAQEAERVG